MSSNFFDGDKPHGHTKRIMLKKCLQGFVPVSYYRTVKFGQLIDGFIIIDGFAGEGRYGKHDYWPMDIDKYGSPLILLMVVLNFYHTRVKGNKEDVVWEITPDCFTREMSFTEVYESNILNETYLVPQTQATLIFVENKKDNFDTLVTNVGVIFQFYFEGLFTLQKIGSRGFVFKASNPMITCTVINCSFVDFSSSFPNRSFNRRACFTFVDPYGYSQTPMTAIQKFVGGENKTFFMNLMSGPINRFVKRCPEKVANLYGYTLPERPEHMTAPRFNRKIGRKLAKRIRTPQYGSSKCNKIKNCADNFQRALIGPYDRLSLMFEMRGGRNNTIYHLVFVTGHEKNYVLMKESMNRCTQYELEFRLSDYDILKRGYALNLSNMQDNAIVANAIFDNFQGRRVSIKDIQIFIRYDTPFVYRKKALSMMEKESSPRITRVEGGTRTKLLTFRPLSPEGQNE